MKCLSNMSVKIIPTDMLLDMMKLYRYSGRDSYYETLFKKDINSYKRLTIEDEVFYFAKIMDLNLTDSRLKLLSTKDLVPKNNDEKIVLNLKNLFSSIVNRIGDVDLVPNEIKGFVDVIYNDIYKIKFKTEKIAGKNVYKDERTIRNYYGDLERILNKFESLRKSKQYEITLLIMNFFIDLYMLKPFDEIENSKFNEISSYITLYVLLYKFEFDVFKYESFFKRFYETMKNFQYSLNNGIFNYDSGFAQTEGIHKIVIANLLECYDSVEKEVSKYSFSRETKQSKANDIWLTIKNYPGDVFKKSDIQKLHPTASAKTIERVLAKLQEEGVIEAQGTGRSASWLKKADAKNGFDFERIQFEI